MNLSNDPETAMKTLMHSPQKIDVFRLQKDVGAVFTPVNVAQFLTHWALRSPDDVVLDPGSGKGMFLIAAFQRLRELGTPAEQALNQIWGVESHKRHFSELLKAFHKQTGLYPSHVYYADLFEKNFPPLDAVIGNPPYVTRARLNHVERLRQKILLSALHAINPRRQADLYFYFIIYATSFLKEGGRLALILSDAWLDADYGIELKEFLLRNFRIQALVSFDRRVFPQVLVKSVLLLVERAVAGKAPDWIRFIRVKRPINLERLHEYLDASAQLEDELVKVVGRPQQEVNPHQYWGVYFKAPELFFEFSSHQFFTSLGELADTRIGLQTLAKNFYIVSKQFLRKETLEKEFFEPIIVSPREAASPILDHPSSLEYAVLLCGKQKEELHGTNVLRYIEKAEATFVNVRAKGRQVLGYHQLPRLQRAAREPWYNLLTEIERRGQYPILLPRRVFEKFIVVWNKSRVIANEDFIEVRPRRDQHLFPLLAVLSSSLGEFMVRSIGHIYGGGVCNLNPNDVKILPVLNLRKFNRDTLRALTVAYQKFIASEGKERAILDRTIFNILKLPPQKQSELYNALAELQSLSIVLKS